MPIPPVLQTLLTAPGPSGYEATAAAAFREAARGFTDDVHGDVMGSSTARVPGTAGGASPCRRGAKVRMPPGRRGGAAVDADAAATRAGGGRGAARCLCNTGVLWNNRVNQNFRGDRDAGS